MRLVTRKAAIGAIEYRPTSIGAASTICSKLSSTISTPPIAEGAREPLLERRLRRCPRMPRPYAIVGSSSSGSSTSSSAHEVDAVGEEVGRRLRDLDREPALADPAGTDERHDPVRAAREQVAHRGDVLLAADRRA